MKNHKPLSVKILKSTKKAVNYRFSDYPDGVIFSVKPAKISKIVYKNGYTEDFGTKNSRANRPFGINAGFCMAMTDAGNLGFGAMVLTSFDYFILPQIDFQLNIGSDFYAYYYYSLGATFHLNKKNSLARFTPFTGVLLGSDYYDVRLGFLQVLVGVSYMSYKGLNISFSLNTMFYFKDYPLLTTQLKIGWRFK